MPVGRQLQHQEVANARRTFPLTLLCADWQDPRNVGSVFRLADAAGVAELVLAGTTPTPPNPRIHKTARSTVRTVPFRIAGHPLEVIKNYRALGYRIIALEVTSDSRSVFDYIPAPGKPILLIAGTESSGVAPDLLDRCDLALHLPMYGQNTSMNVAVALGAAVYLLLMKLQ